MIRRVNYIVGMDQEVNSQRFERAQVWVDCGVTHGGTKKINGGKLWGWFIHRYYFAHIIRRYAYHTTAHIDMFYVLSH